MPCQTTNQSSGRRWCYTPCLIDYTHLPLVQCKHTWIVGHCRPITCNQPFDFPFSSPIFLWIKCTLHLIYGTQSKPCIWNPRPNNLYLKLDPKQPNLIGMFVSNPILPKMNWLTPPKRSPDNKVAASAYTSLPSLLNNYIFLVHSNHLSGFRN